MNTQLELETQVPNQTLDCCFLESCLLKYPHPQKVSRFHRHFLRLLKNQSTIVIFSSVSYPIEIRSANTHYVTCSTQRRVRIVCLWVSCHRLMPNTTPSVFEYVRALPFHHALENNLVFKTHLNILEYQHTRTQVHLAQKFEKNVRTIFVRSRDACGPCWARSLAQSLHRGEKYFLQIDSHMRFRQGWDRFLIEQLEQCESSKPILTTYPAGYEIHEDKSDSYPEDSVRGTF